MEQAPPTELPGVSVFIPEDARVLIGMAQRRGFRLHQTWTSSVLFLIPEQRCYATFRGKAMPLFRYYRLVYDGKENRIDFYVYRFLFFRRPAFSLLRVPEESRDSWLKRYKELLKSIPL